MAKKMPVQVDSAMGHAVTLYQAGRLAEAGTLCQQVLLWQPQHLAALNLLGVIAARSNLLEQAVEFFATAIRVDRNSPETHNNLGNARLALRQYPEAVASYNKAIALKRDYADAYRNRGHALRALQKHAEALASYGKSLEVDPRSAPAHYSKGNVFSDLGQHSTAIACYDAAIALKRDYPEAWHNRGKALCELGQYEAAIASFDAIAAHAVNLADVCCDRGFALQQLAQLDAALDHYNRAISIQPAHVQAYTNRGVVLQQLNQADAALASHERAIALEPDFVAAYLNRGYTRLLVGDYANGWADHEYRLKSPARSLNALRRDFRQPRWDGSESIAGKTILLYAEQGLGDTLQFCRYVKLVAERGARVILEVQDPLHSLLAGLEGCDRVLTQGAAPPEFDCHCSLMSLPFAFKTTLATIPAQTPYLRSDAAKVRDWREKTGARHRRRIGLVWSGGFRPDHPELWPVNGRRNLPLKKLARLYRPDVEFYSLQKGQPAEAELADLTSDEWGGPKPLDYTELLHDFSDTAAFIENLDLIIAVDTSTAHLAAALGKPVWLLNRFDTCWRWLQHRTDSPWYPTIRLYRQPSAGDWDSVVAAVESDL